MATTITKALVSEQDLNLDTEGAATQTLDSRTSSTGGTVSNLKKFSAQSVPVLDAPQTAASGGSAAAPSTPFDDLTTRRVENCLIDIRRNAVELKNFLHYGGVPGGGVNLETAQQNTKVFKQILDDMATETRANGIYFPDETFLFAENAGLGGAWVSHIIPITAVPGVKIVGGGDALLQVHSGATSGFNFFNLEVQNGALVFSDINLVQKDNASTIVNINAAATSQSKDYVFDNVKFSQGDVAISFLGTATEPIITNWVRGCQFTNATSWAVYGRSVKDLWLNGNIVNSGSGFFLETDAAAQYLMNITVSENHLLGAANSGVTVSNGGTFNDAYHGKVRITDNIINVGNVTVQHLSQYKVSRNEIQSGRMLVQHGNVTGRTLPWIIQIMENQVSGAASGTVPGLQIDGSAAADKLYGAMVVNNQFWNSRTDGIRLNAGAGGIESCLIAGNGIWDSSKASTNLYTGMYIDGTGGGTGCQKNLIRDNWIRALSGTFVPAYGIYESGAPNSLNYCISNFVQGYNVAAFGLTASSGVARDQVDLGGAP